GAGAGTATQNCQPGGAGGQSGGGRQSGGGTQPYGGAGHPGGGLNRQTVPVRAASGTSAWRVAGAVATCGPDAASWDGAIWRGPPTSPTAPGWSGPHGGRHRP